MPWREYAALSLFNGVAVGMMAIGLHQTAQTTAASLTAKFRRAAAGEQG
jgi:hypothetical protein